MISLGVIEYRYVGERQKPRRDVLDLGRGVGRGFTRDVVLFEYERLRRGEPVLRRVGIAEVALPCVEIHVGNAVVDYYILFARGIEVVSEVVGREAYGLPFLHDVVDAGRAGERVLDVPAAVSGAYRVFGRARIRGIGARRAVIDRAVLDLDVHADFAFRTVGIDDVDADAVIVIIRRAERYQLDALKGIKPGNN